jgi:hypothetical protein
VENGGVLLRKMHTFTSSGHDIYTELKNKIALNHGDDKRFIIPNTTKTLPWGHSDIEFYQTDPVRNVELVRQALGRLQKGDIDGDDDNDTLTETEIRKTNLNFLVEMMVEELGNV